MLKLIGKKIFTILCNKHFVYLNLWPCHLIWSIELAEHCICFYFSAVKDYTHVVDLARGHVAAIQNMNEGKQYRVSFVCLIDSFCPINNLSVEQGRVSLG